MNYITYFRFSSPYEGDKTNGCALKSEDVDRNFFTLESRDIKNIKVLDNDLIITLYDDTEIKAEKAFDKFVSDLVFEFDSQKGTLKINKNGGEPEIIEGFITKDNYKEFINDVDNSVITNETLEGNGKKETPLKISRVHETGTYKPVDKFIDTKKTEELPPINELFVGERILTAENIDTYGYLYSFNNVSNINSLLKIDGSEWRIPTKEDWDDLLNALEQEENRNHNSDGNGDFGKDAGRKLKSRFIWNSSSDSEVGSDEYGMNLLPCGLVDEMGIYRYNDAKNGYFWTNDKNLDGLPYYKRFDYNRPTVHQDVCNEETKLSIRLVKEFEDNNLQEYEDILGIKYNTKLMPSLKNKKRIWTTENLIYNIEGAFQVKEEVGSSCITKYYINEWDGKLWHKAELKEGESVVIKESKESLDSDDNQEFIVSNGKLLCVNKEIYKKILNEVSPIIDSINSNVDNAEKEIIKINKEISDIKSDSLNTKNDLNSTKVKLETVDSSLKEETSNRVKSEETINGNISKLQSDVEINKKDISDLKNSNISNTEVINKLRTEIQSEITNREDADSLINGNVKEVSEKVSLIENSAIIKEGTSFDSQSGKLKLNTKGGTPIEIQMTYNFGDF